MVTNVLNIPFGVSILMFENVGTIKIPQLVYSFAVQRCQVYNESQKFFVGICWFSAIFIPNQC